MNRLGLIFLIVPLAAQAQEVPVHLRGGEATISGRIYAIDADGVKVVPAPGSSVWIGWDRVLDAGDAGRQFEAFASDAWRARLRVERADYVGAEPLLESVFPTYNGRSGPTAAGVAWGLLRCRLWRGAYAGAVPAMLAYARAVEGGVGVWYVSTAPKAEPRRDEHPDGMVWDETTGLSPLLPPMWVNVPSTLALSRGAWGEWPGRAGVLAELYEQAARFEVGLETSLPARPEGDDGVRLVHDIVAARIGDAQARSSARAELSRRLKQPVPAWQRSWCYAAIGRSLAKEPDVDSRLLGVASLLQVPARAERDAPFLTGLCLAEAAVMLRATLDPAGAATLRAEVEERFPKHPVLGWSELEAIPLPKRARTDATEPAVPPATTVPGERDRIDPSGGSR